MTTDISTLSCAVCGSPGRPERVLHGVLLRCPACTFSWTAEEQPGPEELYDSAYFSGDGYEEYFLAGPRRFEAGRRLRWLRRYGRPSTLVEAGCAGGYFVAAARRAGIDAEGVEVSDAAAQFARNELGIPVRTGRFESIAFAQRHDAVCAFHVLEHVEDPNAFLRAARATLTAGGLLAIEVPNIASVGARRFGLAWAGLQPRYHRWHFTPVSLERLVTSHGFTILTLDTAVFRYYMPARYRLRHAHHLLPADLRNLGSIRLTHPHRGDLLRLVARSWGTDVRRSS